MSTLILILKKKVHRFLFRFLSMHERKLWKKKMIDVHTVNKQKTKKLRFLQNFFAVNIAALKTKLGLPHFFQTMIYLNRVGWFTYLNSISNYKNNIFCTKLKIKVNSYANNELHQASRSSSCSIFNGDTSINALSILITLAQSISLKSKCGVSTIVFV